jgi:hypothetical protein
MGFSSSKTMVMKPSRSKTMMVEKDLIEKFEIIYRRGRCFFRACSVRWLGLTREGEQRVGFG